MNNFEEADINGFFNYLQSELGDIKNNTNKHQALLICSCYIEAIGGLYYKTDRSRKRFVDILCELSGHDIFSYLIPKDIAELLITGSIAPSKHKNKVLSIYQQAKDILDKLTQSNQFYREDELLDKIKTTLTPTETNFLKLYLWKASYASFIYETIRNKVVHSLFGSTTIFNNYSYDGKPVPDASLDLLKDSLENIISSLRTKSLLEGKICGMDKGEYQEYFNNT